jgi:uncharacterized protein DUF3309
MTALISINDAAISMLMLAVQLVPSETGHVGGFSGRFGGYGYGFGHGGISALGVLLIIVVVLLVTGRL